MLPLAALDDIDLAATRSQRAGILPADAEKDQFGRVAKVKADAAPIRATVLADLVPDDVALVREAPGGQDPKALGKERIRHPQVEVGRVADDAAHGQRENVVQRHRRVAVQSPVFRRHLAGAVLELPRRIGEDGVKALLADAVEQITSRLGKMFRHLVHSVGRPIASIPCWPTPGGCIRLVRRGTSVNGARISSEA